jgi:hypothetical protein
MSKTDKFPVCELTSTYRAPYPRPPSPLCRCDLLSALEPWGLCSGTYQGVGQPIAGTIGFQRAPIGSGKGCRSMLTMRPLDRRRANQGDWYIHSRQNRHSILAVSAPTIGVIPIQLAAGARARASQPASALTRLGVYLFNPNHETSYLSLLFSVLNCGHLRFVSSAGSAAVASTVGRMDTVAVQSANALATHRMTRLAAFGDRPRITLHGVGHLVS